MQIINYVPPRRVLCWLRNALRLERPFLLCLALRRPQHTSLNVLVAHARTISTLGGNLSEPSKAQPIAPSPTPAAPESARATGTYADAVGVTWSMAAAVVVVREEGVVVVVVVVVEMSDSATEAVL